MAVSTSPVPASIRGGATGTNWMTRQAAGEKNQRRAQPAGRPRGATNSQIRVMISTAKCSAEVVQVKELDDQRVRQEGLLEGGLAGQVQHPFEMPDPPAPAQRAAGPDEAERARVLPQREQPEDQRGLLAEHAYRGQPGPPRGGAWPPRPPRRQRPRSPLPATRAPGRSSRPGDDLTVTSIRLAHEA